MLAWFLGGNQSQLEARVTRPTGISSSVDRFLSDTTPCLDIRVDLPPYSLTFPQSDHMFTIAARKPKRFRGDLLFAKVHANGQTSELLSPTFQTQERTLTSVAVTPFTSEHLPPPYDTSCRDYKRETPFPSQLE